MLRGEPVVAENVAAEFDDGVSDGFPSFDGVVGAVGDEAVDFAEQTEGLPVLEHRDGKERGAFRGQRAKVLDYVIGDAFQAVEEFGLGAVVANLGNEVGGFVVEEVVMGFERGFVAGVAASPAPIAGEGLFASGNARAAHGDFRKMLMQPGGKSFADGGGAFFDDELRAAFAVAGGAENGGDHEAHFALFDAVLCVVVAGEFRTAMDGEAVGAE